MTEKKLTLNVSGEDRAAVSVLYAYLLARGVDIVGGDRKEVTKLAQLLADNPNQDLGTTCQTWRGFVGWPGSIAHNAGNIDTRDCTLRDAEVCAGSAGFEVAAVVLKRTDEATQGYFKDERRERLREVVPDVA